MRPEPARSRLLSLIQQYAVMYGDFVLSSGQRSRYYLDARVITLSAAGSALVGAVFMDYLAEVNVDAVAGLTVGADPIVASIAVLAGQRGRSIHGLIVRKQQKEHGAGRQIEGPWREGMGIAIVDDTLTTGASALQAARIVEEAGGIVEGVWALIDRQQGAREAIEGAGYSFQAIFDIDEVLRPDAVVGS